GVPRFVPGPGGGLRCGRGTAGRDRQTLPLPRQADRIQPRGVSGPWAAAGQIRLQRPQKEKAGVTAALQGKNLAKSVSPGQSQCKPKRKTSPFRQQAGRETFVFYGGTAQDCFFLGRGRGIPKTREMPMAKAMAIFRVLRPFSINSWLSSRIK